MEMVVWKVPNGNEITYKIINGTAYHIDTPAKVVNILEGARARRARIRIFYGDSKTGRMWLEEHDVIGYIGRSTGRIKIPLLIHNRRSSGDPGLLDHCIVRITENKMVVYQHPMFNLDNLTIKPIEDRKLKSMGYSHSVLRNEEEQANFKSEEEARKYIAFMNGERNSVA